MTATENLKLLSHLPPSARELMIPRTEEHFGCGAGRSKACASNSAMNCLTRLRSGQHDDDGALLSWVRVHSQQRIVDTYVWLTWRKGGPQLSAIYPWGLRRPIHSATTTRAHAVGFCVVRSAHGGPSLFQLESTLTRPSCPLEAIPPCST